MDGKVAEVDMQKSDCGGPNMRLPHESRRSFRSGRARACFGR